MIFVLPSKISNGLMFPIILNKIPYLQTTISVMNCPYIEFTIEKLGKNNKEVPGLYSSLGCKDVKKENGNFNCVGFV